MKMKQTDEMVSKVGIASWLSVVSLAFSLLTLPVSAGTFDSGSDGADGALSLTEPGTVEFDPANFNPPLDQDGDGVYHFTSIDIAEGVTVRLSERTLGTRPITWLATDDVTINGIVDLNGENGHLSSLPPVPARGGAGGYPGGIGQTNGNGATPGLGPGGGRVFAGHHGAGASHVTQGRENDKGPYGNNFLMPLLGGSGGGGGDRNPGGGGGAGGGAILIATSKVLTVNGQITANGGHGGQSSVFSANGGSGSGGAIRLMATTLSGNGKLMAKRGHLLKLDGTTSNNETYEGSAGRIRLEAFNHSYTGSSDAGQIRMVTPGNVFPPDNSPELRVVSVAGTAVPASSRASFDPADLTINQSGVAELVIAAKNVPPGTVVNLTMVNETGGVVNFNSEPLAGTLDASTAKASVTIPHGFSRFTVQASFTP